MKKISEREKRDLMEQVSYDPETGLFVWKRREVSSFKAGRYSQEAIARTWNRQWPGKPALRSRDSGGYLFGAVMGKKYLAHRAAFLHMTGEWPTNHIDHINGNRTDNCWSNLRQVSRVENQKNQKKYKNNTSGVMGVYPHCGGRWTARISHQGQEIYLGIFENFEDAVAARRVAEVDYGFHENHGRAA